MISPKAKYWLKILTKFVSVQLLVQILTFASGILVIHTLTKEEYAYFTLANSMQGVINVLADSGTGSAILSIGGKVWNDSSKFSQLLHTVTQLRYRLVLIPLLIVTPILLWVLVSNGASFNYAAIIVAFTLIELYFYLIQNVFNIVPLLKSRINQIQRLDATFAISRLVLLVLSVRISASSALVYILCSTVSSGLKTYLLKKWTNNDIDKNAGNNEEYYLQMTGNVRTQLPYYIFFCIQGQITIWLISAFGQTKSIADIGALNRLALLFTVISSVVSNFVLPSFAKCQSAKILKLRYFQVMFIYLVFSALLLSSSIIFPDKFLWILGEKYSYLQAELPLVMWTVMISAVSAVAWGLNNSKGWIKKSWLIIPCTITVQALSLVVIDVSKVRGVIIFGLISVLPTLLVNFYLTYQGLKNYNFVKDEDSLNV